MNDVLHGLGFRDWEALSHPLLRVLLVWLATLLLLRFLHRVSALLRTHVAGRFGHRHDSRRIETLGNVLRHTATGLLLAIAVMLTLDQAGVSIAPLLATAGVAGVAIGFGAQSLVKDFFTGFVLLVENQVAEGELIEAAGKSGVVEEVTLRHIRIRDEDGGVHFIPNGMVSIVTNRSRDYAWTIIDVTVARRLDLDAVQGAIRAAAGDLRTDPDLGPAILGALEIEGLDRFDDAAMTVRSRLKVMPPMQQRVRRALLAAIRRRLDAVPPAAAP